MKNKIEEILSALSLAEKISILSGVGMMSTAQVERLGLKPKKMADGPHGVRKDVEANCTSFPGLSAVGATWDVELVNKMGVALAKDCIHNDVDMLLAPGVNIKRHILCGRNFEYFAEDPVLAGELGAAYINGLQSLGVAAALKHFAANNQERYRITASVDVDIRTLMEIYLKAFEIAVKKSSPVSVMCAYNKLHSIWCSENKFLLTEVLRDMWGYKGFVISDWGAVQDSAKSLKSGLDLQMPENENIHEELTTALENGTINMEDIDTAVKRVIEFLLTEVEKIENYDRDAQHEVAREVAAAGTVLLKNEGDVLPVTKEKYKKIAVIGEFAKSPLISGQGSAEVHVKDEYVESPYDELVKILGDDVKLEYQEIYQKASFPREMLWLKNGDFKDSIADCDLVMLFVGSMESEDTEQFDRRTAEFNPNYDMFVKNAVEMGKKIVVVIQSGSAMILGEWMKKADAVVQMWLGGEGAGGAVADILCGNINPCGKLSETFPTKLRADLEYPGNGRFVEYKEGLFVGYRYYDLHKDEIEYPFGHGLSYTEFEYKDIEVERNGDALDISFMLKNTGNKDGAEVAQLYVGDPVATVVRPLKELKAFKKVFLKAGEAKRIDISVDIKDIGYYNVLLKEWITEPGKYVIYVGASSQDIRLEKSIILKDDAPYSIVLKGETMMG